VNTVLQWVKDKLLIGPTPSGCCDLCRRPYRWQRVRLVNRDSFRFGGAADVDGVQETCPKHGAIGRFLPEPSVLWRRPDAPWARGARR
jgi:hypothetical protein